MKKQTKLIIAIAFIALAAVLTVIGWIILPDTLMMQITLSGEAGTTLPKPIGILIPFAVTALFSYFYYKVENKSKYLFGAGVGLILYVLIFTFNM